MPLHLRALLADKGVSQTALAEETGLSFQAVNALCRKPPEMIRIATLERIGKALRMTPGEVLDYVPRPPTGKGGRPR